MNITYCRQWQKKMNKNDQITINMGNTSNLQTVGNFRIIVKQNAMLHLNIRSSLTSLIRKSPPFCIK